MRGLSASFLHGTYIEGRNTAAQFCYGREALQVVFRELEPTLANLWASDEKLVPLPRCSHIKQGPCVVVPLYARPVPAILYTESPQGNRSSVTTHITVTNRLDVKSCVNCQLLISLLAVLVRCCCFSMQVCNGESKVEITFDSGCVHDLNVFLPTSS